MFEDTMDGRTMRNVNDVKCSFNPVWKVFSRDPFSLKFTDDFGFLTVCKIADLMPFLWCRRFSAMVDTRRVARFICYRSMPYYLIFPFPLLLLTLSNCTFRGLTDAVHFGRCDCISLSDNKSNYLLNSKPAVLATSHAIRNIMRTDRCPTLYHTNFLP